VLMTGSVRAPDGPPGALLFVARRRSTKHAA
jgi:hypothetical protein